MVGFGTVALGAEVAGCVELVTLVRCLVDVVVFTPVGIIADVVIGMPVQEPSIGLVTVTVLVLVEVMVVVVVIVWGVDAVVVEAVRGGPEVVVAGDGEVVESRPIRTVLLSSQLLFSPCWCLSG